MKQIIEFLGLGGMVMGFVIVLIIFMTAYSHPEKKAIVKINKYGEADIEFILLIILVPCVAYTIIKH